MQTMKKTSLLIAIMCAFFVTLSAQSQYEKGKILAGISSTSTLSEHYGLSGVLGWNYSTISYKFKSEPKESEYRVFAYNFLTQGAYFVIDNLAVGLGLNFIGSSSKEIDYDDKWKESKILIGPFARYYYPLEKFHPFGEATYLFGGYKNSSMDKRQGSSVIGIGGGVAVPIGEIISIDAVLKYVRATEKWEVSSNGSSGGTMREITGGIGFNIGISFYFDRFF